MKEQLTEILLWVVLYKTYQQDEYVECLQEYESLLLETNCTYILKNQVYSDMMVIVPLTELVQLLEQRP